MKSVLIIGYGEYSQNSTRGICVLADTMLELGFNVTYLSFPCYIIDKIFWRNILHKKKIVKRVLHGNSIVLEYANVLIPYYSSIWRPLKIALMKVYEWSHGVSIGKYLLKRKYGIVVVESGRQVLAVNKLCKVSRENLIYRQSDPIELGYDSLLSIHERKLIQQSRLSLFPNEYLLKFYKNLMESENIELWENGILVPAKNSKSPYTENINLVYFGLYPIDIETLKYCADRNESYFYHIFGPFDRYRAYFKENRNVKIYGYIEYEKIVPYIEHATICLLPYVKRKRTEYSYITSKIHLYMYFQKPIVSTNFSGVGNIQYNRLYVAGTKEAFFDKIIEALLEDGEKPNIFNDEYLIDKRKYKLIQILKDYRFIDR